MRAIRNFVLFSWVMVVILCAENTAFDYLNHGDNWSETSDTNKACASGIQQSPIEIHDGFETNNKSYFFADFYPKTGTINFLNTTIFITSARFGEVYTYTIKDMAGPYRANQIRVRSEAEHVINGRRYPLELQISCIYQYDSMANSKVTISLLFDDAEDQEDAFLKSIMEAAELNQTQVKKTLDLSPYLNKEDIFDFWLYEGSSTIPPCYSGQMNWIISKNILKMSKAQSQFFYKMFHSKSKCIDGNWRNTQPLNKNVVNFFTWST